MGGLRLSNVELWIEYTQGKQTYKQLATKYAVSKRTISRRIDQVTVSPLTLSIGSVAVLLDTSYWGKSFGVMVFKDAYSGAILYTQFIKQETNTLYKSGIAHLQHLGFEIKAIICDGRKGLLGAFESIPVQMCQFHQAAIVTRYLTKRPKMQAAKELQEHMRLLPVTDKESFVGGLVDWEEKWADFLAERSLNPITGKTIYTHRRLRSAVRSIKTNMQWLFTCYDYPELNIPNTTNALDGLFSDLKNKLRNHNGLSKERKQKFINEFFKAWDADKATRK
jgi:hypothetical protein